MSAPAALRPTPASVVRPRSRVAADGDRCPAAWVDGDRSGRCLRDTGFGHGRTHIAFGGIAQGRVLVAYWMNEWS